MYIRILGSTVVAMTLATGLTACSSPKPSTGVEAGISRPSGVAGAETTSRRPTEVFQPLWQDSLPNVRGKSLTAATVTFPPRARAVPHRHGQAFVFAYVLQGSVRSQVESEPIKTVHAGGYWTEDPGAHHLLTENASATKPAKLLVVFVADTGSELKVDDHQH